MGSIVEPPLEAAPAPRRATSGVVFWSAVAAATLVIGALVAWSASDASYRYAAWLAKVDLGLKTVKMASPADEMGLGKLMVSIANKWQALGSRMFLLLLLYAVGITASACLLFLCIGTRSATRRVALAAVCAGWILLFATQRWREGWAIRRQALGALPQAEIAAAWLRTQWPPEGVSDVPPNLKVIFSKDFPNRLIVTQRKAYPTREEVGFMIERSENGTLRFKLSGAFDCNLEFHPQGSEPHRYADPTGHDSSDIVESTLLKEHWYLVRYDDS